MNKGKYIIACLIFLLLLATNITTDKFYMNYQLSSMKVNNPAETGKRRATIQGDNTNEGDFIETPNVDLPQGVYKIIIKYKTDTDLNYIKVSSNTLGTEIKVPEDEKYLYGSEQEKVVTINLNEDVHNFKTNIYFCGKGTFQFKELIIESARVVNTDTIVWCLLFLSIFVTIGILAYNKPTEENKKRIIVILCLLAVTGFASYPFFNDYIMEGHDIAFHLTRIEGIKNGLLSGQFPVRVHPSTFYNYGYAPSIFYPELFLYIPALLRIAGMSLTGTVQLFFILINFLTASIMYFSVYRISKVRSIGIISSILYVLASYHLCDIYTRFALGEVLAMAFIPLLIYGVYELICNDFTKWKFAVIGATGILQSHIITTLIAIAFVGLAVIICFKNLFEKNRLIACIKATIMVLLVNLWFIVPLVTMMRQNMRVSSLSRDVEKFTLYVTELFQNFTVNGESRNIIGTNLEGVMSLHIGLPILIGMMLFAYTLVENRIKDKSQEKLVATLLGFGILSAFATTNLFPWKLIVSIPLIGSAARMIQFPWRMLAYATAFLSIVAAYGIFYFVQKVETRRILIVAVFAMSSLFASHYLDDFNEKEIFCYKGSIIINKGVGTGEYYYEGTNIDALINRGEIIDTSSEKVAVNSFDRVNGKLNIDLLNNSNEEQYIEIPLAYYPFYNAKLNNNINLKITKGENNVVRIIIPSNTQGSIQVKYHERHLWQLANIISAIAIIFLLLSFSNKICLVVSKRYQNKLQHQPNKSLA